MIKASIDRPKLEQSLKRFAKDFGDTNAQALCRWGVQTCRELAGQSQVFGTTTKAKLKQWNSIEAGMNTILSVVPKTDRRRVRVLSSVEEVSEYIDSRRNAKGRTRSVPVNERPFVTQELLEKTLKARRMLAGIAKGGWIGAGQDIAKAQKGADRINIGKNFLGYAQKHGKFGASKKPRSGWNPNAEITNTSRHSGAKNVLTNSASRQAINWGLKKTVKWYASALRKQNQKQKP